MCVEALRNLEPSANLTLEVVAVPMPPIGETTKEDEDPQVRLESIVYIADGYRQAGGPITPTSPHKTAN